jgi:hypothetical protein
MAERFMLTLMNRMIPRILAEGLMNVYDHFFSLGYKITSYFWAQDKRMVK